MPANSNSADQLMQLAITHHQNHRLEIARKTYQEILKTDPKNLDVQHILGVIALQTGDPKKAVELLQQTVENKPDWPEARSNLAIAYNALGILLHQSGQLDQAIVAYNQSIQINSAYSEALANLCLALSDVGNENGAIVVGRLSIAANPENTGAHHNLSIALNKAGELGLAIKSQQQAIALSPESGQGYFNLGNLFASNGQLDEAIIAFENAVNRQPSYSAAFNNLGNVLIDAGQVQRATIAYEQAVALKPENSSYASAVVFCALFQFDVDARTIAEKHFEWGFRFTAEFRLHNVEIVQLNQRMRIGYFSPDFRDHPVARFFLPLLENHDRSKFEIICYSAVVRPDATTARLKSLADIWRDISALNHDESASLIRADRISILIDLAGHTSGGRLPIFARKPAPIQISYLGYPATTGLSSIDFRWTDHRTDPVGMTETLYTEKLYRLPHTNWCFTAPINSPSLIAPPMLKNGFVTFGSFNRLAKVTDAMLDTWLFILRSINNSRLILKAAAFVSHSARSRVESAFRSQNIDLIRLTLLGPQPDESTYLACTQQIDIALDTFPYHGTKTTCDMLWMGVPVITLAGKTHVSRVGVSLLSNVGLNDLIAPTVTDYIKAAVDLAGKPTRLIALRQSLRDTMLKSPLMNAVQFAQDVDTALMEIWEKQQGLGIDRQKASYTNWGNQDR